MERKCVNCKWRSMEAEHICMNEKSDKLSQYVDREDECEEWEFIGDE